MMLSEEQRQFFEENGYLRYGRVLTLAQVDELRAALDHVIAVEAAGGDDSAIEFKFGHRRGDQAAVAESSSWIIAGFHGG